MNNEERIKWIRSKLESSLCPTFLIIQDDSAKHIGHEGAKSGAGHFTVEISSLAFEKKTLVNCHRLIYEILAEAIPHEIHALKIKIRRALGHVVN